MAAAVKGTFIKGTAAIVMQAEAGLALLKQHEGEETQGDAEAAGVFKAEADAKIAALKAEADALAGKDNKKARTDKGKEAAALSSTDEYIDAMRVLKGLPPKHGHFVMGGGAAAPAPEQTEATSAATATAADAKGDKKDDKKAVKKQESAGISKAERDELEKLKSSLIDLKKQLKDEGMSGGEINKDVRVVAMVTRMTELKEKESPDNLAKDGKKDDKKKKAPGAGQEKEVATLTKEIEEYHLKLTTEFKYSKKEIAADPDMVELTDKLAKATGKK